MAVYCLGDIRADIAVILENGSLASSKVSLGGTIANFSVISSKLGQNVRTLGTVADDVTGRFLLSELSQYGIDVSTVTVTKNGMNNILLALDGGNLLGYSIMEIPNTRFDTLGDIDFDAVSPASGDYVHTSSGFIENYPTENRKLINFLRKAKDNGAVISFDLNLRINEFGDAPDRMNDIREIVMLSDIVFGAFDEFESLSGLKIENAVELYSKGRLVIARNESDPIMFAKDSIKGTVKVEPVHVINPSGAGDTFDAAFIYAIERNDDLITCISFASYIAGYMISHEEKRAVPDKDTVRKLLEL